MNLISTIKTIASYINKYFPWSQRIIVGLSIVYFTIANFYVPFEIDVDDQKEVLQQIITVTALLVSLLFAVIIPIIIHEKEQRVAEMTKYRTLCSYIKYYVQYIAILKTSINHSLFAMNMEAAKSFSELNIDANRLKLIIRNDSSTEPSSEESIFLQKLNNEILQDGYLFLKCSDELISSDNEKQAHSMSEDSLFTINGLQLIENKNQEINNLILRRTMTNSITHLIESNIQSRLGASYEYLIIASTKNLASPFNEISNITDSIQNLHKISQGYFHIIREAKDILNTLLTNFNFTRHKDLYFIAFYALIAGVIIPLSALLFNFEKNAASFSTLVVTCSIYSITYIISFLRKAYTLFSDDLSNLR